MNSAELINFVIKHLISGQPPSGSGWPKEFTLTAKIWDQISNIQRYTATDGHEYESVVYWVDGDTVISKPVRGSRQDVKVTHELEVRYSPQRPEVYTKSISIDRNVLLKQEVKRQALPKSIQSHALFNIHSHPAHVNGLGKQTYGFFSSVDINTFLASNSFMMGLITDKIWFACKTSSTIKMLGEVGIEMLNRISEQSYTDATYLDSKVRAEMTNWGIVFYNGPLKGNLVRVN